MSKANDHYADTGPNLGRMEKAARVKVIVRENYGNVSVAKMAAMAGVTIPRIRAIIKELNLTGPSYNARRLDAIRERQSKEVQKARNMEEMRSNVRAALLATPFQSNRLLAEALNVAEPTIAKARRELHKAWMAKRLKVIQIPHDVEQANEG